MKNIVLSNDHCLEHPPSPNNIDETPVIYCIFNYKVSRIFLRHFPIFFYSPQACISEEVKYEGKRLKTQKVQLKKTHKFIEDQTKDRKNGLHS